MIPRDGIEIIDDPRFSWGAADVVVDRALVFEPDDGPARAYPIQILNYHEIVNDVLDGTPVAATWCPLRGIAVVYDRVVDGQELTFGVSGKLAEDDLVMYDGRPGRGGRNRLGRTSLDGCRANRWLAGRLR